MRILSIIAESMSSRRAHPTTVLNALIELENDGGITSVYELEYRMANMVKTLNELHEPAEDVAQAWLQATRAYLETYAAKRDARRGLS